MRRSLTDDMLATDLAEYLVRKGVSLFLCKASTVAAPFQAEMNTLVLAADPIPGDPSHLRFRSPTCRGEQDLPLAAYARTATEAVIEIRKGRGGGVQLRDKRGTTRCRWRNQPSCSPRADRDSQGDSGEVDWISSCAWVACACARLFADINAIDGSFFLPSFFPVLGFRSSNPL